METRAGVGGWALPIDFNIVAVREKNDDNRRRVATATRVGHEVPEQMNEKRNEESDVDQYSFYDNHQTQT